MRTVADETTELSIEGVTGSGFIRAVTRSASRVRRTTGNDAIAHVMSPDRQRRRDLRRRDLIGGAEMLV
jgi:hypothetical protein